MIVRESAGAARTGAAALVCLLAAMLGARAADDKPYVMKISLATFERRAAPVSRKTRPPRSSGIPAVASRPRSIPESQLGSVQRQIEGVQFGAIQMAVIPPEFYAGIDERFEVLTTPGLVRSMAEGQRLAADPQVRDLMLGLGAGKGLHGAALFMATQSSIIAKAADPSPRRPQGQEDQNFRLAISKRGDEAAWSGAKADDLGRCVAGASGQRHRWRRLPASPFSTPCTSRTWRSTLPRPVSPRPS